LPSACVTTLGNRNKLISERYQHFRERGLPYGLHDSLCTLHLFCSSRLAELRHRRNTRYGWAANPYPTGTYTPQDAPSFAWRANGPRKDATAVKLSGLKPPFDKKNGTVTAGNSSFLTDGASAVLLMSETKAKELGLTPLAYLKSFAYSGQDPVEELLLGPIFSIAKVLEKESMSLDDIGVLEIHEAFAAQMLANIDCMESDEFAQKKLGLSKKLGTIDMKKLNLYGGSLSIGHPFGATGARLLTTCARRMKAENQQYGIVSGCAAGAVGNAILLENP